MKYNFIIIFLIFTVIFTGFASAEIQISKITIDGVIIKELGNPAVYDFKLKNLGDNDDFEFYNFFSFTISPVGTFNIPSGFTQDLRVEFHPPRENNLNGFYNLEYYIKGKNTPSQKDFVTFKIVSLKDVFEIGSDNIQSGDNSIKIYIANKESVEFEKINAKFSSAFFQREEEFSLAKNRRNEFTINLNPEDYKRLVAGTYTLKAEIEVNDKKTNQEAVIRFLENENVVTNRESSGVFIDNLLITKSNEGNVVADVDVLIKKNIITRLFTSFNPEADEVVREGADVYYSWKRKLNPSEKFQVNIKTNYLFPLILILLIVLAVVIARILVSKHVIIRKRVSFVRIKGKGGDFALKVTITIQAKEFVERVNVIDRLPAMVKVHEQFIDEKPDHIDDKTRRIIWKFDNLDKGEIRKLSYIVYSRIGVLGKFVLPRASIVYERNGDIHEAESNKAYFIAEQSSGDTE